MGLLLLVAANVILALDRLALELAHTQVGMLPPLPPPVVFNENVAWDSG